MVHTKTIAILGVIVTIFFGERQRLKTEGPPFDRRAEKQFFDQYGSLLLGDFATHSFLGTS